MSKIISIDTAVPAYRHEQDNILSFMQSVYALNEVDKRKLRFLYRQSSIDTRYSVIPDYSLPPGEWRFYPPTENLEPFPDLEKRMEWFNLFAPELSVSAISNCIEGIIKKEEITHLITVTCTGMSAPGLDLQILELMSLAKNIFRTSVNFMGCYAAVHALKLADALCTADEHAKVIIVCTELCTLHFQNKNTPDNVASSLLFGDGAAAVLVMPDHVDDGLQVQSFYSEVSLKGKKDMSWQLSSTGFQMTLSGYIPDLIEEDFASLLNNALENSGLGINDIDDWCIHPGGKKILTAIEKSIGIPAESLASSSRVLRDYGNMSSPTILFVLKEIIEKRKAGGSKGPLFGAAFGPGLTLETFILT